MSEGPYYCPNSIKTSDISLKFDGMMQINMKQIIV